MRASVCVILLSSLCAAAAQTIPNPGRPELEASVRSFLYCYLAEETLDDSTRYVDAFVDLNGDGHLDAIVLLVGAPYCGTGGCTMLVLRNDSRSFRFVSRSTVTRAPILVLNRRSTGWLSIAVTIRVDSVAPKGAVTIGSAQAELRYDGKSYPLNPTGPPARLLSSMPRGQVVIPAADYENAKTLGSPAQRINP